MKTKIVTVKLFVKAYERGSKKESDMDVRMKISAFLGHESNGYDPLFYRYEITDVKAANSLTDYPKGQQLYTRKV